MATNWARSFEYGEPIHETVESLCATCARISFALRGQPEEKEWHGKMMEWSRYRYSFIDMDLPTQEIAQKELSRISAEYRKALAFEKETKEKSQGKNGK